MFELPQTGDYEFGDGLWCGTGDNPSYFDSKGKRAVQGEFEKTKPISEGLAPAKSGGKWGVLTLTGEAMFALGFEELGFYDGDGLIRAKKQGQWGLVDLKGKTVIEFKYEEISPWDDEHFVVRYSKT